jgi:hypothetical protein
MRRLLPVILLLTGLAAVPPAAAQETLRQGLIKSQAIQPMPPGFSMAVVIYDDTELNLKIKDMMESALKSKGLLVIDEASALDMEVVSDVVAVEIQGKVPYLGQAGTDQQNLGASVRINVWSREQNSLLGGEGTSTPSRAETSFHINAQLRDSETGRVLWHGDAYAYMPTGEPELVMGPMIENLAAVVGETTSPQQFPVN